MIIKMLQFAALAAGHKVTRVGDDGDSLMLHGVQESWRPHRDCGDAFQLEAAMTFQLFFYTDGIRVGSEYGSAMALYADHGGDKNAARRFAGANAAAKIGMAMKGLL